MAKTMESGHKQIYQGIDPKTGKEIWKYEHRLNEEKKLGRKLRKGEVVHHKDGNPGNNSASNLEVTNKAGHNKIDKKHHLGGRKKGS